MRGASGRDPEALQAWVGGTRSWTADPDPGQQTSSKGRAAKVLLFTSQIQYGHSMLYCARRGRLRTPTPRDDFKRIRTEPTRARFCDFPKVTRKKHDTYTLLAMYPFSIPVGALNASDWSVRADDIAHTFTATSSEHSNATVIFKVIEKVHAIQGCTAPHAQIASAQSPGKATPPEKCRATLLHDVNTRYRGFTCPNTHAQ
jgi:hypothetical protein